MQDDDTDSMTNLGAIVNPDEIWNFSITDNVLDLLASSSTVNLQSSDSGQENATEGTQWDQALTSLLPRNETTSAIVDSTSESACDFYAFQPPEQLPNTSTQEINDFEGQFEFQVKHPKEDGVKASKSTSWTYSPVAEELYVKMDVDCPLLLKIKGIPLLGTYIRATPLYIRPEDMNSFPKRCLNHSAEQHETNRGHPKPEHLIRCSLSGTEYTKDEATGRMSTILPFIPPQIGSNLSTYVVRFMCRTSCPGGMNRRPMSVLFTLEYKGECLGRQIRKVKVCACPGRDRHQDELRFERSTFGTSTYESRTLAQDVKKACKRISANLSSNNGTEVKQRKVFTITVHSRTHYNILSGLIPILEKNIKSQEESSEDE